MSESVRAVGGSEVCCVAREERTGMTLLPGHDSAHHHQAPTLSRDPAGPVASVGPALDTHALAHTHYLLPFFG